MLELVESETVHGNSDLLMSIIMDICVCVCVCVNIPLLSVHGVPYSLPLPTLIYQYYHARASMLKGDLNLDRP